MPLVTDNGFQPDPHANTDFLPLNAAESGGGDHPLALALANDADPRAVARHFGYIEVIAVDFPHFADGRGFSLARRLRLLGYQGRLRAKGHLIADQYPMARACGFDEVEVPEELAARQPEVQWIEALSANSSGSIHAQRTR